ncbi:MAG: hypothetical protein ACK56F_24440 [bacterium]
MKPSENLWTCCHRMDARGVRTTRNPGNDMRKCRSPVRNADGRATGRETRFLRT